jgi:1,5-anhydro-D-fructose reductase (1,5-anhydro-D-mannitol-forming)
MVGHLVRFSPLIQRIREIVRSGILGTITYARADFVYDARLSHRQWLRDRAVAGGGPVFDIGVHCLDTLRFVLGDDVIAVNAVLSPAPTTERTEESALLGLTFSRGTVGAIYCSYIAPTRRKQLEIIGTGGVVTAGDFTAGERQSDLTVTIGTDARPGETRVETFQVPNLIAEEVRHFTHAVFSGGEILTPGENGLANQRVLDAVFSGGNEERRLT